MTILRADTKITKSDKRQMNRFKKWKLSTEDDRITEDLSKLLRSQGDKVLNGNITLCLTSQVLASLNRQFHGLTEGASYQTFQVANEGHERDNIAFIFDFLQKVPKLKVTSGPVCSPSPLLTLSYFKLVCHLEIKKIPIFYLKGLTQLRRQIKSLTCSRSTNDIKTVVYQFGKEGNNLFALTELEILDLSYNTIRSLDDSLRLLPSLKRLNLSHNSLTACDLELAPSIDYLNLGYNNISKIPRCSAIASIHLSTVILRNNNLCDLQGVQNYVALKCLDVSGNCIVSFDELVPLAQLQRLVNLNLEGNPLGYMLDYRINTIARLCPVTRREPVYLDGKALSAMEELCLGRDVEPVPLSAYIPSQPIGRPSGSLRELAKSLHELSRGDSNSSNSVMVHTPAKTAVKKRTRKFREAVIIDASTPNTLPAERLENNTTSQEKLLSTSSGPITSRRSETDDSVLWIHPGRDSEEIGGLETLDYASYDENSSIADDTLDAQGDFDPVEISNLADDLVPPRSKSYSTLTVTDYDLDKTDDRYSPSLSSERSSSRHGEQGIYSSAPVRLNSMMSLDDGSLHSIDNFSEDEDEELYLVQSVVANAKDRYGREEKESIFLVIRQPDIIERDPFNSKTLHRLDLNYLQDMTFHTLDPLRIVLRFNLLRQDRKERVYIFEDPDNMNNFIEVLKPIVKLNQDREFAQMLHYQCLRCFTEFAGCKEQESGVFCPTCGSTLVVEREDRLLPNGDVTDGLLQSSLNTTEGESQHTEGVENRKSPAPAKDSPLGIVVPFARGENTKAGSLPTSFYIREREVDKEESCESECTRTTQSVPKAYTLSMEVRPEIASDHVSLVPSHRSSSLRSHSSSEGSALSLLSKKSQCSDSYEGRELQNGSPCSSRLETESRASDVVDCSRTSTPPSPTSVSTSSCKSRGSHLDQDSKEVLFNKDEFKKLHHRIMLFLFLNVLKDDLDSFYCALRTACVSTGKQEEIECLLVISASHVIILKVDENEREVSENMLQSFARHNLEDLKYIDYGYFNQSFRLDFSGNPASYKFLVRDTLRCERFLATLLCELENSGTLQEPPRVSEEPNPQTVANLRYQLFDEKEDLEILGRRLFVQATSFSSPPALKVRKIRMRSHDYSFAAREFIDWLVSRRFVKSKTEGVDLLQRLADATVIQSVGKDSRVAYTDAVFKFPCAGSPKQQPSESQLPERTSEEDTKSLDSDSEDEDDFSVMRYHLLSVGIERRDSCLIPRTLVMTKTHLYLADECHQWPLSRFLSPPQHLEDQFLKVDVQQIINATKMEFYDQDPCCMKISFVDECCDDGPSESSWIVKSETARTLSDVSTAIREHWKKQFTIELPCSQLPQLRSSLL